MLNAAPILSNTGLCPGSGGSLGLSKDFKAYASESSAGAGRRRAAITRAAKKAGH